MHTLSIIAQKGGAGKTTLAIHLAVVVAQSGLNVALIDIDRQASSTDWRANPFPVHTVSFKK